jgi:hypothetical protein
VCVLAACDLMTIPPWHAAYMSIRNVISCYIMYTIDPAELFELSITSSKQPHDAAHLLVTRHIIFNDVMFSYLSFLQLLDSGIMFRESSIPHRVCGCRGHVEFVQYGYVTAEYSVVHEIELIMIYSHILNLYLIFHSSDIFSESNTLFAIFILNMQVDQRV